MAAHRHARAVPGTFARDMRVNRGASGIRQASSPPAAELTPACRVSPRHAEGQRPLLVPVYGVAALGSHARERDRLQRAGYLPHWQVGKGRAHAAPDSRNEVTNGVSVMYLAGSSTSSKYNSTASARFASASSIVCPWLATSTSRH